MTTLELDNEKTALLAEMAENEHTTLAKLANRLLVECLEDWQDARAADKALTELEQGEDTVISFEEWERQLDGMALNLKQRQPMPLTSLMDSIGNASANF
ncbi:MAG: DUF6290 family protein [Methylococcaceae bacterium]